MICEDQQEPHRSFPKWVGGNGRIAPESANAPVGPAEIRHGNGALRRVSGAQEAVAREVDRGSAISSKCRSAAGARSS
jgi:hypothetical protein